MSVRDSGLVLGLHMPGGESLCPHQASFEMLRAAHQRELIFSEPRTSARVQGYSDTHCDAHDALSAIALPEIVNECVVVLQFRQIDH